MAKSYRIFIAFGLLIYSAFSVGASFDCAKAATLVETTICSDQQLSDLDSSLSLIYKNALKNSPNSTAIKNQQRDWLQSKRNSCQTLICLKQAYLSRISEFNDTGAQSYIPQVSGIWKIVKGDCLGICAMDDREINKLKGKNVEQDKGFFSSPFVTLNYCGLQMDYEIQSLKSYIEQNPEFGSLNLRGKNIAVNKISCPSTKQPEVELITLDDNKTAVMQWDGVFFTLKRQ